MFFGFFGRAQAGYKLQKKIGTRLRPRSNVPEKKPKRYKLLQLG
jgi:hypothetical protein